MRWQGFFEREELERILGYLSEYLSDLTRFAYHTGAKGKFSRWNGAIYTGM